MFLNSCAEAKSWISEKMSHLSDTHVGNNQQTIRALQRKHQVRFALRLTLSDLGRADSAPLVYFRFYIFPCMQNASEIRKFSFVSYSNKTVTV